MLIFETEQFQKFDYFRNLLKSQSIVIDLYQRANSAEYRMDEKFQNCQFLEPNSDFPNWKNLEISYFSNLDNSKNFKFEKFEKFAIWQIEKKSILKIPKICNVANSKNLHFLKYQKFY